MFLPTSNPSHRKRLAVLPALLAAGAVAAAQQDLGSFKAWAAMRVEDGRDPVCMMWSEPAESEGDYQRRGDVFVFVTHRPGETVRNKVSFETGYTFKAGSEVGVTVNDERFTLYTDGSTAWSYGPDDEQRLIRAMRAGRAMTVEGTSSRGTDTRDTFSLFGFSKAHDAINRSCARP